MQHERRKLEALFDELIHTRRRGFPVAGQKLDAPTQKGVYVIYSPHDLVLHVGSTPWAKKGIAQRLRDHVAGKSSFTIQYLKGAGYKLRRRYKFCCLKVKSGRKRALLEAYAIGHLCPRHIGHGRVRSIRG